MILYAFPIFLGAFLLFLVQPIIAKQILPWFGGSAAVWATCMVFFQMALLLGYAKPTGPRAVSRISVRLSCTSRCWPSSLLLLPIIPDAAWKPTGNEDPRGESSACSRSPSGCRISCCRRRAPLMSVVRVAFSSCGAVPGCSRCQDLASLLALLFYPVAIEPWVTTATQSVSWSVIYDVFALLSIATAVVSIRNAGASQVDVPVAAGGRDAGAVKPGVRQQLVWLALAAMASFLLLAVTNHISQNIASLPFLWILPLSLYLATFIFCFDHPALVRRNVIPDVGGNPCCR